MPRAAHMSEQLIRACSSLTQLYHSLVPSADTFRKTRSNFPLDMKSSSLAHRPSDKNRKYTERGFSIQKQGHVGWLSPHCRSSVNKKKNAGPFVERSRIQATTIKIALNMLRHSLCGKREIWHALLNAQPCCLLLIAEVRIFKHAPS